MSYQSCIDLGWPDGIHDVRHLNYPHKWLVIHRDSGTAKGCQNREEAREVWRETKRIVGLQSYYTGS